MWSRFQANATADRILPSRSILIVLFTVVLNMTGVGLVWPILPTLVGELAAGSVSHTALIYGSIAVVFSIMQFVFAPILGALSDRFGRRPVMLLALTGLGLDNIMLAFAPSIEWIFAGRALGGIFGATFAVANAYMADVSAKEDRAAAFGMVGAAFGIGFILGPLIGGVLGEYDLRLPFYCAAVLSLLNVAFGWFFLEESLAPENRGKKDLRRSGAFSAITWLASNRIILPLAIALLIANTMQRGMESIWVLFTGVQYGWGTREAGFSLAIVGISFVLVQGFLVRRVVTRFGELATIVGGFSLSALMYLLLAFNTVGIFGYLGIIPHVIGWGVAGPALQALASRQVSASEQGFLQGGLSAISGLAAILGPAIATGTFAWFTGPMAPAHFPGAFFLAGCVLLVLAAWTGSRSNNG
jgi:DHA1 family tetracycline resistance protein-like MFS transporter